MRNVTDFSNWKKYRDGINEVLRRCPDSFNADIVYRNLIQGRAHLYEFDTGFCVLEILEDQNNHQRALNVWLMYSTDLKSVWNETKDALDDIAIKAGCSVIQFRSPRKGWERHLEGIFEPKLVIYERKV